MNSPRMGQSSARQCYHNDLLEAIGTYLPHQGLPLTSSDRRRRWTDRLLAVTSLLMVWQSAGAMRDAFAAAREAAVSMYRSRRRPGRSFEGFIAALQLASDDLIEIITQAFRRHTQRIAGAAWRRFGYVLVGVDGSRINCSRTAANEEAFGCAGKDRTTPQQLLTTIYHICTGLPWDWRHGRGDASEHDHLLQMADALPKDAMLLMDAGFTGYELLKTIIDGGRQFIVRVGSNVRLLKKLGYAVREHGGIVYLWPLSHRGKEPIVLRLVVAHDGRKHVYLLTSVLSKTALGDRQVAQLYRLRWGVEVMYRGLKQTMAKRKMLSDAPHKAQVELDWSMMGLWLLGLMTLEQTGLAGQSADAAHPRWSLAAALRVLRQAMRRLDAPRPSGGLNRLLGAAVMDVYRRDGSKLARDWPHKKKELPPGRPRLRMATASEVTQAQRLWLTKMSA